jgi:hypothetical protein
MNCRRATRRISDSLDRPLSIIQRLDLGLHLLICPPCARFRRAVRWLHQSLPAAPWGTMLPADARARIRQALEEASEEI